MFQAAFLALLPLFCNIVFSFGLNPPSSSTGGDDEPNCLSPSDQPSSSNLTIQSCQNGTTNAICWPPNGANICYPQRQKFLWSPAYFEGKQIVHLFFNEDPSNMSTSEIWIGSDPVGNGYTYESFTDQEYNSYGPSHTFQVWAVGSSSDGTNRTIAPNPPTYTLVYSPDSTPDYDSGDDYDSDDDDDLSAGGWAAIVIAVFASVLGITMMSICCCKCCQGTRNKILPPSRRRPLSHALGQQPVPFNQTPNNHDEPNMNGMQIPGFPRARLPDPRRQDVRWHVDEQLPAYQKEPTGESPPAYDHNNVDTTQTRVGSTAPTGNEPRAEDAQQGDSDNRGAEHVPSDERDGERTSNNNVLDVQSTSTQRNTQHTT